MLVRSKFHRPLFIFSVNCDLIAPQSSPSLALLQVVDASAVFDSNCITPGTEFMARVSAHLRYFIRKKQHEDPIWRRLHVVFSGHEVFLRVAKLLPLFLLLLPFILAILVSSLSMFSSN